MNRLQAKKAVNVSRHEQKRIRYKLTPEEVKAERKERKRRAAIQRAEKKLIRAKGEALVAFQAVSNPSCNFLVIDFEAYEFNQKIITEAGITMRINGEWDYHHYRIKNFLHLRNGRFVPDEADNFQFGDSKIVTKIAFISILKKILKTPNLHLVGHGVENEIKYANVLGIPIPKDVTVLDTQNVFSFFQSLFLKEISNSNNISLAKMLTHLNIRAFCLHNAGNDARYTSEALREMTNKFTLSNF
ncbi:conserved fungal nucleolar protein, implicated in rDNA metabolism or ribosome biogenesis [Schizosaccharomyces pombe]|uniref:Uncharacterized nucleolar protein C2C4.08 n=1 Tax=Schizosaccharomyces pombe (strain 972 / ATCC 24843) TaxID=284812 RepID=YEY8_SCHPO|nr:uncharacterized protein SPAC2C4.08 [Schizosaccharomyces pombe]O14041.1 RecName: Full=Uncharacterized nucleolar protein C2C4.08 [Schizosaccharomyces pombe 972h-]CAB16368.1 conserved fungal protein [Schizosaccharomyces pombe]|eukprot:NP_594511.1 uncharacterized protein SPAC2C4.08 [Schizosaccharomyces pombe]